MPAEEKIIKYAGTSKTGVAIIFETSIPTRSRLIFEASAARMTGLDAAEAISACTRKLNLIKTEQVLNAS